MSESVRITQREVSFEPHEIIVSKTDTKGRITYSNDVFLDIAGYTEAEVLGQPHSIIRHPDMPRSVFHLLWETIAAEQEIFAYVKNKTKTGDFYWVLAHVTPSYDLDGSLRGYHSNRRVPDKTIITTQIIPLYKELLAIERSESNRKDGMHKATAHLSKILSDQNLEYAEFISKLAFAA